MSTNKPKVTPAPAANAAGAATTPPAPGADAAKAATPPPAADAATTTAPAADAATKPPAAAEDKEDTAPDSPLSEEAVKAADNPKKVFHKYQARKYAIRHPYQEIKIPVSGHATLFKDSWIDAQVGAKVITDLGPTE